MEVVVVSGIGLRSGRAFSTAGDAASLIKSVECAGLQILKNLSCAAGPKYFKAVDTWILPQAKIDTAVAG